MFDMVNYSLYSTRIHNVQVLVRITASLCLLSFTYMSMFLDIKDVSEAIK